MRYTFYPGCASEATGKGNIISFEAVAKALGMEIKEIPDWNCCGATLVANAVGDLAQLAIAARNLALAEKMSNDDIIIVCSSCYLNLAWVNERMKREPEFAEKINEALAAGGLSYSGNLRVRHMFEVMVNDVGLDKIRERTIKPLEGLKVACYSGCQTVRALRRPDFDDVEHPTVLDRLVEALGATAVPFPMAAQCCGGSQQFTNPELIYELTGKVLDSAAENGADVITTSCPMCAMNADAFQQKIRKLYKKQYKRMPVLFVTQLMGVAFDLKPKDLAFQYNIVSPNKVLKKYGLKK